MSRREDRRLSSLATVSVPSTARAQRAIERAARGRRAQIAAGAVATTGAAVLAGHLARRSNGSSDKKVRAYRFKAGEKPAKGVRKIVRGRIEDALVQLSEQPDGKDAAVHKARKDLKKLRSLLRLVRGELRRSEYRTENARYRDAGRLLSDLRDADVKLETLATLIERFDDLSGLDDFAGMLHRQRAREDDRRDDAVAAAAAAIDEGGDAVEGWRLPSGRWNPIGDGFARSYRRGRRAYRRVRDGDGTDEAVHEWRKRAKDLWYHLRVVRPAWRAVLEPAADEAHKLGDLLGDHHDLALLSEDARAHPECFDDGAGKALLSAIRARQEELLEQAIPLGALIYAEKPKAASARLAAYWENGATPAS
jgi:CHAD domain-containing protein